MLRLCDVTGIKQVYIQREVFLFFTFMNIIIAKHNTVKAISVQTKTLLPLKGNFFKNIIYVILVRNKKIPDEGMLTPKHVGASHVYNYVIRQFV